MLTVGREQPGSDAARWLPMDLNGSTILLTGGTGSFGSAFVDRAAKDFPDSIVRVFSRDEQKQSEMQARFTDS